MWSQKLPGGMVPKRKLSFAANKEIIGNGFQSCDSLERVTEFLLFKVRMNI